MITDTTDCMIIRESEWGVYDTARVQVTYACGNYVRLADGTAFKLTSKQQLIEGVKNDSKRTSK